jgi:DnaK suppressor protein
MSEATYGTGKRIRAREEPRAGRQHSRPAPPAARAVKEQPRRNGSGHTSRLEDRLRALLALQARLQGDVTQVADVMLSGYDIEAPSASPDAAELAGESVEQDVALGLLGSAAETLNQIEAALRRIDDGTYGRCERCGAKIPPARLEAIPYATRCVPCAARQEEAV